MWQLTLPAALLMPQGKTSMPVFSMSQKTEEVIQETDEAYHKGKLASFSSPDEMFDNLDESL